MPWVKLDDQFVDHPKVVEAGPLAAWLYVCGLAYCARQLTDGFVPAGQLRRLVPTGTVDRLAERLVAVGLWETTAGGFRVHDYLQYNPTRAQVMVDRQQRSDAGRRGGVRSGEVRAAKHEAESKQTRSTSLRSRLPSASSQIEANANPVPVPLTTTPTEYPLKDGTAEHQEHSAAAAAERHKTLPEPRYSADFDRWWAAYPRKREKVAAFAVYEKALRAGATPDDLLAAARNYATAADEEGAEDRFIKLPATFLSLKERPWLDFREGVPRRPAGRNGAPAARGRRGGTEEMLDRVFGGRT